MYTFTGPDDLMNTIRLWIKRADEAAKDESDLKREQAHNRARSAALSDALKLMEDYFSARKEE